MIRAISVALLALTLAACGGPGGSERGSGGGDSSLYAGVADRPMEMAMAPAAPPMPFATEQAMNGREFNKTFVQPDPGGGGATPAGPGGGQMMSYRYFWNFSVPTENMQGLQAAHRKLCEDAGPANCYVTNSSLEAIGKVEGAYGQLSIRATEAWVDTFEASVSEGLKPFGGSVYATGRDSEDLTTQIVDHEARLRSMIAHRDALQKMIDDKPGRLSDLLEIQRSLAEAQGNIDANQSYLAALRERVSMSVLTFNYQPEYAAVSNSIWRPITDAFGDFGPAFAQTVAGLIRFVAAILPVLVLAGLGLWLAVTVFRWRGRTRPIKPPVSSAKSGS